MSSSEPFISCPNLACGDPQNTLGNKRCHHCDTPLIHRYLWATGFGGAQKRPGELIAGRYYVVAPQVWLDTQPGLLPQTSADLLGNVADYLKLYPQRLHIPEVYGFASSTGTNLDILLLDNAPVDAQGRLHPTMVEVWSQTTSIGTL
jgi:protein phosphatase